MTNGDIYSTIGKAAARLESMEVAVKGVEVDYGEGISLYELHDDAIDRLDRALRDFISTAYKVRRAAEERMKAGERAERGSDA